MKSVTVYNLGGAEALGTVSVHHAIHMVYKGKATIREIVEGQKFGPFDFPKAVELVKYVVAKWKYSMTGRVPFRRVGVLIRDNYTCAYCGKQGKKLVTTVDYVLPKWQGNHLTWNNAVAACEPCNFEKGGRSPEEAGMPLKYAKPYTPLFQDAYAFVHGTKR